jgi:hypothetical protein
MRIFPAMLLLAACGDNLRGPDNSIDTPTVDPSGTEQPAARWEPEICGIQTWDNAGATNLSMSVTATDMGSTIFGVPTTAGPIVGYTIDAQGKMSTAGKAVTTASFTHVAATYVGGKYLVAATSDDKTTMMLVSEGLTYTEVLGVLEGGLVAAHPLIPSRRQLFTATAGNDGLQLAQYDVQFNQLGTNSLADGAVRGLDAVAFDADALVAWSTSNSCTVQTLAFPKTAIGAGPCMNPRLAVGIGDRAELAYTRPEGVFVGDLYMSGNNAIASVHPIASNATSPRIVFDGQRYWMSYIDARGGIAVGFLTDEGQLISMALEDTAPSADGYDLKLVDGQPVVYSAGPTGYAAHTMCIARH